MSKYFKIHLCFVLIYMYTSHIHQFISGRYKINNSWRACTSQKIWCWAIWNANIFKRSPLFREPGLYPSLPLSVCICVCIGHVSFLLYTRTLTLMHAVSCHPVSIKHGPETIPIVSMLTTSLMPRHTCWICSLNLVALRKPPGSKANF